MVDLSGPAISRIFGKLQAGARQRLDAQVEPALVRRTEFQFFAEARYLGQSFNVSVMLPEDVALRGDLAADVGSCSTMSIGGCTPHASEAAPVEDRRAAYPGSWGRWPARRRACSGQIIAPFRTCADAAPLPVSASAGRHDTAIIGWSELAAPAGVRPRHRRMGPATRLWCRRGSPPAPTTARSSKSPGSVEMNDLAASAPVKAAIDPIQTEIMRNRFAAIVEEAASTVVHPHRAYDVR